jgi:hypothetical protein
MGVRDGPCRFSFLISSIVCGGLARTHEAPLCCRSVTMRGCLGILHFSVKCGPGGPSSSVLGEVKCLQQDCCRRRLALLISYLGLGWTQDTLPQGKHAVPWHAGLSVWMHVAAPEAGKFKNHIPMSLFDSYELYVVAPC